MAIVIRDVTQEDIQKLSVTMRECDKQEVHASSGLGVLEALQKSVEWSPGAQAGLVDGDLVAIFGTAPACDVGDIGVPWLLGAKNVSQHAMPFLRLSRKYIQYVEKDYSLLTNFVDARNTVSIAWLRWLGFEIFDAEPYGPFGLPFHRFEKRGTQCVNQSQS